MRFHIPGLPHTVTKKSYTNCAYTQKVYKLCKMLYDLGHEVYHYGCETSNPICTEQVDVISYEYKLKFYPEEFGTFFRFDTEDELHHTYCRNCVTEIRKRCQPGDFLLCSWGWGHEPIATPLGSLVTAVESGIGYNDTFTSYRVFESYAWMHYMYGKTGVDNGPSYDCVIPNYFDPDDFEFSETKDDYVLYIGRLIRRKGVQLAVELADHLNKKLIIAGPGELINPSEGFDIRSPNVEHVGSANVEQRKQLMSRAQCVIVPTYYIEPFGGVSIEAALSGTPVLTTDWGVFTETILHGITGYRCRNFNQFVWGLNNIHNIAPKNCYDWAINNYTMERVALMYQEYFEMLLDLPKKGWYELHPERNNLDWLARKFPPATHEGVAFTTDQFLVKRAPIDHLVPKQANDNYVLNEEWYHNTKKSGISFMVRANNEEATIGECLESLRQLKIPYEINVCLNSCTDNTKAICLEKKQSGLPIHIFEYNCNLSRAGIENVVTPVTNKHSAVFFANWCLEKGTYNYTFRWDADFIMSSKLAEELSWLPLNKCCTYKICAANNEMSNCEPYLFCNSHFPRFDRYMFWESLSHRGISLPLVELNGTIHHKSDLKEHKSYWLREPWWNNDHTPQSEQSRNMFDRAVQLLGSDNLAVCRSSDYSLNFSNTQSLFEAGFNSREMSSIGVLDVPIISIIMMSRKRPAKLNRLLDSLQHNCRDSSSFEVLIKTDTDDDTVHLINTNREFRCRVIQSDRKNGYLSSTEFLNDLAKMSSGSIFWTLNDDLICKTKKWDTVLRLHVGKYKDGIVCLYPDHTTHSNNCFPVWTRTWYETFGRIAPNDWPHIDSWLSSIAKTLGREVKVPIFLEHDVIHGATDETYQQGSFNQKNLDLGNTYIIQDNDPRQGDIEKLKQVLVA